MSYRVSKTGNAATPGGGAPAQHLLAENRALKAELARVREQRDLLKKIAGLFTEPSKNDQRIEAMSGENSIAQLGAALGVTPRWYHAWRSAGPSRREAQDAALLSQIRRSMPSIAVAMRPAHSEGLGATRPVARDQTHRSVDAKAGLRGHGRNACATHDRQ